MWCKPGFASISGIDEHALEIRVPHVRTGSHALYRALYKRLQRRGVLYRDAVRMVTNDRNIYAASMLAAGDADAMVTGVTRNYAAALTDVRTVLDASHGVAAHRRASDLRQGPHRAGGRHLCHELPNSEQLADIAIRAAATARKASA